MNVKVRFGVQDLETGRQLRVEVDGNRFSCREGDREASVDSTPAVRAFFGDDMLARILYRAMRLDEV